ncbi:phage holin family protein [Rhizosphaericola mali]|uniref:Phage holin family protein n=1 Tax=Rhizosphaericola mali TaxID=2545455 RepID=A0A5P2G041_9BACT|nr:phage holin family protein [Rhizosphaericola mali]QES88018.1 phage holin family protein [Rhizosphaericola mali]
MLLRFIGRILVTALAAVIAAHFLKGVTVAGGTTPIILALVLAILNAFVKPILVILTIPVTILTLGLFLIVINIIIIMMASHLVDGFHVDGWISALLFSILLSVVSYILELIIGTAKK